MDALILLLLGLLLGITLFAAVQRIRMKTYHDLAEKIVQCAEDKAKEQKIVQDRRFKEEMAAVENERMRLLQQKEKLEQALLLSSQLEKQLKKKHESYEKKEKKIAELEAKCEERLENIAKLTRQQARKELIEAFQQETEQECSLYKKNRIEEVEQEAEKEAKRLITIALERMQENQASPSSLTMMKLPDETSKGKIIGRDGKNIATLENCLGVTLILEDQNLLFISSFDPVRRHVAELTLKELLLCGRINPTKILDTYAACRSHFDEQCISIGKQSAEHLEIYDFSKELLRVLGSLKFRTSFGQNVLQHSVEVALLMESLAKELKLCAPLAKRIGLLHDIGKALDHTYGPSHALAGYNFVKKEYPDEKVANGVGAHHKEQEAFSPEAFLCGIADAFSAKRKGARENSPEIFCRRLETLEKMALEEEGVEAAYAMQGGRELRLFVSPDRIDEGGCDLLAKRLRERIEGMKLGPKVEISVIRETKASCLSC
jgi:ribonucrease Y